MRHSYNCVAVNDPKTIGGVEWRFVVVIFASFGLVALMEQTYGLLIVPFIIFLFLRGPAQRDDAFLAIYRRHRVQRDRYSPAYITKKNQSYLRPMGYSRLQML